MNVVYFDQPLGAGKLKRCSKSAISMLINKMLQRSKKMQEKALQIFSEQRHSDDTIPTITVISTITVDRHFKLFFLHCERTE